MSAGVGPKDREGRAQVDALVSASDLGHVGLCVLDDATGRAAPNGGGAQKTRVPTRPEQLGGLQGCARTAVRLRVSEVRRLCWCLVLATQQRAERILACATGRRWHQGIANYWPYKRRAVS